VKIGVLTGGGDSPAINAAIRAIVYEAYKFDFELSGIRNGWAGLVNGELTPLSVNMVDNILTKSGTILGTSRTNPFKINAVEKVSKNFKEAGLDALIAIGGDDTLGVLHKLHHIEQPINGVGIPQTIDNDIMGTDYAIGFDTAVTSATDAVDKLRTTAESHHRVMVLEVMGRDAGHIALRAGVAGGAHLILVPEEDFDMDEVCDFLKKRKESGRTYSVVIVAEGAKPKGGAQIIAEEKKDQFGHVMLGGIGGYLAGEIERCTQIESRVTILGHLQRGGIPTAFDRFMATRYGVEAVKMVERASFDQMVALKGKDLTSIDLGEGLSENKPINMELYHQVRTLE